MNRVVTGLGLLALAGCLKTIRPRDPAETLPQPGKFPHEIFEAALAGKVTPDGLVDYKAFQADRAKLDEYVGYIALTSPESHPELFPTRDDQLAYWINAYNALAITTVIDRPGLQRVVDNQLDFFVKTRYPIGADKTNLYTLENGVVRPTFEDPRVHFALNCQSAGCPRLPQTPFPVQGLDATLDQMSAEFVNHPKKVTVEGNTVRVNEIFKWYDKDFEAAGGAIGFVRKYRSDIPADAVLGDYIEYDWTLIAQPGKGP